MSQKASWATMGEIARGEEAMDSSSDDEGNTNGVQATTTTTTTTSPADDPSYSQQEDDNKPPAARGSLVSGLPSSDPQVSQPSASSRSEALLLLLRAHQQATAQSPSASAFVPTLSSFGGLSNTSLASSPPSPLRASLLHQHQLTNAAALAPSLPVAATSQPSILEQLAAARANIGGQDSSSRLNDLQQLLAAEAHATTQRASLDSSLLHHLGYTTEQLPSTAGVQHEPGPLSAHLQRQLAAQLAQRIPLERSLGGLAGVGNPSLMQQQLAPHDAPLPPSAVPPSYTSILEQLAATQASRRPISSGLEPASAQSHSLQQLMAGQQLEAAQQQPSLDTVSLLSQLSSAPPMAPGTSASSLLASAELMGLGLLADTGAGQSAAARTPTELRGPSDPSLSASSPLVHQILSRLLQDLPGHQPAAPSHHLPQAQGGRTFIEALPQLLHQLSSARPQPSSLVGEQQTSPSTLPPSVQWALDRLAQNRASLSSEGAPDALASSASQYVDSLLNILPSNSNNDVLPETETEAAARRSCPSSSSSRFMENIAAADLAARENLKGRNKSKEKRWMRKYEELKQFREDHGHCRVPHGYPDNRKLSWWVMNQRAQYHLFKQGKETWLTQDRVRLLDAIDFDWTATGSRKSKRR